MGNCAISPQYTKQHGGDKLRRPITTTANIIHLDGSLQEFREPVKVRHILSQNPTCFLCSSESMFIGSQVPHLSEDEELQLGQMYFLLPLSKSQAPLTLQDLCSLAIKASKALPSKLTRKGVNYLATPQVCCEVPTGFQIPTGRSNQRNEF